MKKVMEEMENLQKAEDSLMELQDKQVIPNVTQIQDQGQINYFPHFVDQLDKNHNPLEIMGDSLHCVFSFYCYIRFILDFVTSHMRSHVITLQYQKRSLMVFNEIPANKYLLLEFMSKMKLQSCEIGYKNIIQTDCMVLYNRYMQSCESM